MDSEDNHPNNEDNCTPSLIDPKDKKRKGRGATRLPDVIKNRSSGVKPLIDYDEKGRPKGKNKPKFSSYLGVLARTMVPLHLKDWFEVTDELKEKLWSSVQGAFDVDPRSKKDVLSSISSCSRTFRKTLTKHIYANKSNPIILSKPPEVYSFLEQKEWDSFVKRRITEEFEELCQLQQKRRECNLYDHRLSRKGYSGLEEEMVKNSEEPIVSVDRSLMWKKARQNKNGEYENVKIKEKDESIDEIAKKVEDGTLQTQGSNDILTMALGGIERGGRTRAVGKVTPTNYFHVPKRGIHSSCEEKHGSLESIVSSMQVRLDAFAQGTPHTPQSDNIGSNTYRSDNIGSQKVVDTFAVDNWERTKDDMAPPNSALILKGKACKLAVGSINNIVAHGMVFEKKGLNELLHTVPLGKDNLRVSVDIVKVEEALLPIPIPGEATTVGEAVGFHVAWPSNLVLCAPESKKCMLAVGSVNNIVAYGTIYTKSGPNELLHMIPLGEGNMRVSIDFVKVKEALLPIPIRGEAATIGEAVGCHIAWPQDLIFFTPEVASKKPSMVARGLLGGKRVVADEVTSKNADWKKNLESIALFAALAETIDKKASITILLEKDIFGEEVDATLQKVDTECICYMKKSTAICIMLYIRQLYLGIKALSIDSKFAFVNPCILSHGYKDGETSNSGLLASRLQDVKNNQLLLVPCNIGVHWVLCVVDLSCSIVYYMDSVNNAVHLPLQIMIKTAFRIYHSTKGIRRNATWKIIECPKQPTDVECGYYVMRYMKDLIIDESILSRGNFDGKKKYTKVEIDEVRVEWINSVMNHL